MNNSSNAALDIANFSKRDLDSDQHWELQWVVLLGILLVFIMATAVTGNILTLAAFIRDKSLQNVYNTYLFNLASTDLLTTVCIMPVFTAYTLRNSTWEGGHEFCLVELGLGALLGAESVLMMLLISLDRFLLFRYGARYILKETKRRAVKKIIASWIISLTFMTLMVVRWIYQDKTDSRVCEFQLHDELTIVIVMLSVSLLFISPFIILGCMHVHIYYEIRRRSHIWPRNQTLNTSTKQINLITEKSSCYSCTGENQQQPTKPINLITEKSSTYSCTGENQQQPTKQINLITEKSSTYSCTGENLQHPSTAPCGKEAPPQLMKRDSDWNITRQNSQSTTSRLSIEEGESTKGDNSKLDECIIKNASRRRHKRAAQYLSSLVLVFGVCWAPHMITSVIDTVCSLCVEHSVYTITTWVLLLKCSINPHLYATNNKKFRQNFHKMLRIRSPR